MAVTKGKIAKTLFAKGNHQTAIKTYEEELFPIYRQLGDKKMLLISQANLAIMYKEINGDTAKITGLLCSALQAANEMQIPEAEQIEGILEQLGLSCE